LLLISKRILALLAARRLPAAGILTATPATAAGASTRLLAAALAATTLLLSPEAGRAHECQNQKMDNTLSHIPHL
jgi:hypothetical protein